MNWHKSACIFILILLTIGCGRLPRVREDISANGIPGFFLLNEGQEGSNNCTLDFYDYTTGIYSKNIFEERNPELMSTIGDVGTDMAIYANRLWIVVNHSNLVEVIDVNTGWHQEQIPIPNCRSITFKDDNAYVSSYNCPVGLDPNAPQGYVLKINTQSLDVMDTCYVGYQPEEMAIVGDYLFVANSGIYRVPNYDNTISVIDRHFFREIQKIEVAPNLHRMEADAYGNIWVSSRGDHYDIPSMTFVINAKTRSVADVLDQLPCTDMTLCGDSLYIISNVMNYFTQSNDISYSIVDVKTHEVVTRNFITDGTDEQIQNPYGIAVNPQTHEILITDARDYVTPGKVYCFSPGGVLKWSTHTGDIPSRIVFTHKPLL